MAVRDTIQIGDPRLKNPNQLVTNIHDPKVKQIITDLIDTMRAGGSRRYGSPANRGKLSNFCDRTA